MHIQDYVLAFVMGTHLRLGESSRVLLLDPCLALSIAKSCITDKWSVYLLFSPHELVKAWSNHEMLDIDYCKLPLAILLASVVFATKPPSN